MLVGRAAVILNVGPLALVAEPYAGDDWHVAAGVAVALGVPSLLTRNGVNAWWLIPASVALVLTESLRRTVRRRGQDQPRPLN